MNSAHQLFGSERISCPDCGCVQLLPPLREGYEAECSRCAHVLAAHGHVDRALALSVTSFLFFVAGCAAPLLAVHAFGAHRQATLFSGAVALWKEGFPPLAILVAACTIALPFIFLGLLILVLTNVHSGSPRSLGWMFRWVKVLRPWVMSEVYLVGGFVAYSRIKAIAGVSVGTGGWCLIAATFALLLALTQLDEHSVWRALRTRAGKSKGHQTIACTACHLVVSDTEPGLDCPRCRATLRVRKPNSLQRTTALILAGYFLYIPANILPVLIIVRFGREDNNTIMSGVRELIHDNLWPLAVIVFVASIVLPLMKLCGLTWMLVGIRLRSELLLVARTRFYRLIDAIGRWSTIDVFMSSILIAVLQFGTLTAVHVDAGLLAFAAVIILTMLATLTFDARLMWDSRSKT